MKHRAFRIVRLIVLLLALASAGYLAYWYFGSVQNRKSSQATASKYVSVSSETPGAGTPLLRRPGAETGTETDPAGSAAETAAPISVDFDALRQTSDAVVGWIRVSGLDVIDYPIVRKDDEFYLTHAWDGSESHYGAIFMEEKNNGDFSDYHTIVYGHNMRDGSMFGDLRKYADEAFFRENGGLVTVCTPAGIRTYQIFSAEYVDSSDTSVYTIGFSPSDEYTEFLRGMITRSLYDTGVQVTTGDRVLTLSTCSYGEKSRFVVHARQVS